MIWLVVRKHPHEFPGPLEQVWNEQIEQYELKRGASSFVHAPAAMFIALDEPDGESLKGAGPGEYAVYASDGADELPVGGFPFLVGEYVIEESELRHEHPRATRKRAHPRRTKVPQRVDTTPAKAGHDTHE